jgi:hypothetical protein
MSLKINIPNLTRERIEEMLEYDAERGSFTWRKTASAKAVAGSKAGGSDLKGHRTIQIDGVRVFEHRLVWFIETGYWPIMEIDHINMNGCDNRFSNLREATSRQNKHNLAKRRTKTSSKYKGVFTCKVAGKWRAQIRVCGRSVFLGHHDDEMAAAIAYDKAAVCYFGEYARVNISSRLDEI